MTELTIGIEWLAALGCLITGLSHIAAPRAWARFFIAMRERSAVPGFVNAYVHAPLGLLIVAFHPVWNWPGIGVTLFGWALTLKGTLYFIWPKLAERSMARVSEERAGEFRIAGLALLLLGAWFGWISLRPVV